MTKCNLHHKGILGRIKTFLDRSRIGELLVIKGLIVPNDLRFVLAEHKRTGLPVGQVLINNEMITSYELRTILCRQMALRFMTTLVLCVISFSSFGAKRAKADPTKDVPAQVLAASVTVDYSDSKKTRTLFGTEEKRSTSLSAFTKWTGMFERFDSALKTPDGQKTVQKMQARLEKFKSLPLRAMADKVNSMMNEKPYIIDSKNWDKSDYWETPIEFMAKGGDCEDFAIAKYTALRTLGVPEERLRVAIVQDTLKNIPHAVLVLYMDDGIVVLDNQNKSLMSANAAGRYQPIFSINREAWWLHTTPEDSTQIASR
jgi:predicted transglutaminase-like cysteine proteinase